MLKFVSVLLLLAFGTVLGSADDYFKNAIFPALKAKDGQLSSEVLFEFFGYYGVRTYGYRFEEKHSFKWNSGNLKGYLATNVTYDKELPFLGQSVYLNGSEFYSITPRFCHDLPFDNYTVRHEVENWASRHVFKKDYPYKMLGKSLFLKSDYSTNLF